MRYAGKLDPNFVPGCKPLLPLRARAPYWHLIGGASAQGSHNHPNLLQFTAIRPLLHRPNHNAICFRRSDPFHLLAAGAVSITAVELLSSMPAGYGQSCHYHIDEALGTPTRARAAGNGIGNAVRHQNPIMRFIAFLEGVNGDVQRYRRN